MRRVLGDEGDHARWRTCECDDSHAFEWSHRPSLSRLPYATTRIDGTHRMSGAASWSHSRMRSVATSRRRWDSSPRARAVATTWATSGTCGSAGCLRAEPCASRWSSPAVRWAVAVVRNPGSSSNMTSTCQRRRTTARRGDQRGRRGHRCEDPDRVWPCRPFGASFTSSVRPADMSTRAERPVLLGRGHGPNRQGATAWFARPPERRAGRRSQSGDGSPPGSRVGYGELPIATFRNVAPGAGGRRVSPPSQPLKAPSLLRRGPSTSSRRRVAPTEPKVPTVAGRPRQRDERPPQPADVTEPKLTLASRWADLVVDAVERRSRQRQSLRNRRYDTIITTVARSS